MCGELVSWVTINQFLATKVNYDVFGFAMPKQEMETIYWLVVPVMMAAVGHNPKAQHNVNFDVNGQQAST